METPLTGIPKVLQTFKRFTSRWDGNQAADIYLKKRRCSERQKAWHTRRQPVACLLTWTCVCMFYPVYFNLVTSYFGTVDCLLTSDCLSNALFYVCSTKSPGRHREGDGTDEVRWARHQHARHCSVFITYTHTFLSSYTKEWEEFCLMSDRISAALWHILCYSSPIP